MTATLSNIQTSSSAALEFSNTEFIGACANHPQVACRSSMRNQVVWTRATSQRAWPDSIWSEVSSFSDSGAK
jgi:hypothetical protein